MLASYPAGSGEALLRYVLFFWIMYKIYIFMQCAPIFILCFQEGCMQLLHASVQPVQRVPRISAFHCRFGSGGEPKTLFRFSTSSNPATFVR